MNRIQLWPTKQQRTPSATQVHQAVTRQDHRQGMHYSVFAPLHYEPNYAYPLLVWLHGPTGDERQLQRVMPLISMRNYVAVAPRGTERLAEGSYDWGHSETKLSIAEQSVCDCIGLAQEKFKIATDRIFLAGYQSGGTAALHMALSRPDIFSGALSIGGAVPRGTCTLAELNQARKLPLFITVGEEATSYTVEQACDDLRLLHTAGMTVALRQYPCGDEIVSRMLTDMDHWMMEQVTGVPQAEEELTYLQLKSWN